MVGRKSDYMELLVAQEVVDPTILWAFDVVESWATQVVLRQLLEQELKELKLVMEHLLEQTDLLGEISYFLVVCSMELCKIRYLSADLVVERYVELEQSVYLN